MKKVGLVVLFGIGAIVLIAERLEEWLSADPPIYTWDNLDIDRLPRT